MPAVWVWLRAETRPDERRTPLVPDDVAALIAEGVGITVERSAARSFPDAEYEEAGAPLVDPGSWVDAPTGAIILGLKELPPTPVTLRHSHAYFGHAFRGQPGAALLRDRFGAGGGELLDLEYLCDAQGRRLAAFGHWAGYVGAALALLEWSDTLTVPLSAGSQESLDRSILATRGRKVRPRALVIGSLGRSGRGALAALQLADTSVTAWDVEQTRQLDRAAMMDHDIVVNAVLTTQPVAPFLTLDDLVIPGAGRRLSVLSDVTCDVGSARNVFPLYSDTTTWDAPVLRLPAVSPAFRVIAIDNLPSLLPRESSRSFSASLRPHIPALVERGGVWRSCQDAFVQFISADLHPEPEMSLQAHG